MRKLSVRTDPTNMDSTCVKRKFRILDHQKNVIEDLRVKLVIVHHLTGNKIITGPNQYRFTQIFLDGEALRIFVFKLNGLRHENVANLILVMDHVVNYFGPKRVYLQAEALHLL